MQCTSHSRLGRRCWACSPSIVRLRRAAAGFYSRASMDFVIGSRQAGHTHIGLWPAAASLRTWLQLADVGRCILLQVGERRPHPRRDVHPHLHEAVQALAIHNLLCCMGLRRAIMPSTPAWDIHQLTTHTINSPFPGRRAPARTRAAVPIHTCRCKCMWCQLEAHSGAIPAPSSCCHTGFLGV